MSFRAATTYSRRVRYCSSIPYTSSIGPVRASIAAFCTIDEGLDVAWLWSLLTLEINAAGPSKYPRRQPVMANVLESEPDTTTCSFSVAEAAIENGSAL